MQLEFIGVVLLLCPRCSQKHVTNTESLQSGVQMVCACGYRKTYHYGSKVTLSIQETVWWGTRQRPEGPVPEKMQRPLSGAQPWYYDSYDRNERERKSALEWNAHIRADNKEFTREDAQSEKQVRTLANAVPLDEYKTMLSGLIVTGYKPRVARRNCNTISFNDKSEEIRNNVEALIHLGYKEADALKKVNVEVEQGFFSEEAITKKILSM